MENVLIKISIYITLLPVLVGLIRFKQLSINQKVLFWMIVLISLNQLTSQFLEVYILEIKNNLPFYRVYILIEFTFLSFLFYKLIKPDFNWGIWLLISGFVSFWLFDSFIIGTLWTYPEILRFSEGLVIIFLCMVYFYKVFRNAEVVILVRDFGFWMATGLAVYFASNNLLFLFSEFVLTLSDTGYYLIWTVHAFLTILLYIAYTIAIQCKTNHNLS